MANQYEIVFTMVADTAEEADENLSTGGYNWSDWTRIEMVEEDIYGEKEGAE